MKKTFVKPEIQVLELRLEERISNNPGTCSVCGGPGYWATGNSNSAINSDGNGCYFVCQGACSLQGQPCPICGQDPCDCDFGS